MKRLTYESVVQEGMQPMWPSEDIAAETAGNEGHTPFTSTTLAAKQRYRAAGSTLPGKASIACFGIQFLFDNGSEPG